MTAPDDADRAGEIRALPNLPAFDRLASARPVPLLLWSLSRADPADPTIGVLRAVRPDLELLIEHAHVDSDTMEAGLIATARRLDTAIERLRWLYRADETAAKDGAP